MSYDITAKQVMNKNVVALRTFERVTTVLDILQDRSRLHSGFPVVEAQTRRNVTSAPEILVESHEEDGKFVRNEKKTNACNNDIEMNLIEEVHERARHG